MPGSIIEVKNLSKSFIISYEGRERYTALRDVVTQKAKKVFSFPSSLRGTFSSSLRGTKQSPSKEEFWALKDVSFNIEQGDRVGIIGRNGAGKSTLLKILSRITEPTQGEIRIKGRVASLLEVGTGFHPELTGRENIFLNGAILGMSRAEIKRKFDEIVDFAEVEKFLDMPVKRYSSGMYVRLAFAVAAHLEPEILIVDEVLAVGDAQFQKKCLGKMEDVSKSEGRTVLFVSHNLSAVKALCTSSIILHKGKKILQGDVFESLAKYMSFDQSERNNQTKYNRESIPFGKKIFVQEAEMFDDQTLDYFCLQFKIKIQSLIKARIGINIRVKDVMGFPVAAGFTHYFLQNYIP
ncbi:MAG: ABC transporter ATP-binding protein [Segetibacter sp.]